MDGKTKLKRWRDVEKLTQVQAAERFGVKVRTYQYWESGKYAPDRDRSARVHAVTGIATTDWITSEGESSDWT